jgi:hypothetical protein
MKENGPFNSFCEQRLKSKDKWPVKFDLEAEKPYTVKSFKIFCMRQEHELAAADRCYNREMTDMAVLGELLDYTMERVVQIYMAGALFRAMEEAGTIEIDNEREKACFKLRELLHKFAFYAYMCVKVNSRTDAKTMTPEIVASCLELLCTTGANNDEAYRTQMNLLASLKSEYLLTHMLHAARKE